eukprot:828903-Alexandrium_andersonii.AAC.1
MAEFASPLSTLRRVPPPELDSSHPSSARSDRAPALWLFPAVALARHSSGPSISTAELRRAELRS